VFTWYDFIIFNLAVVMVFPQLFFPGMSGVLPVLAFAVGFLARPLGSAVFGVLGDLWGRKTTLVTTLYVTGISTVIIGVMPTHQDIGVWATVALVMARLLQTAAVGGEWAAASVLLTEHNDRHQRRGFLASFVSSSFAMASVLSTAVFMAVMSVGESFFMEGGWRIPFLLSGVLLVIGVYIRRRVVETPDFQRMQAQHQRSHNPLRELFRDHGARVAATAMSISLAPSWVYGVMVFGTGYMLASGLITRPDLTATQFQAWWIIAVALIATGWLTDRVDRVRILDFGALASLIMAWPVFWLIQQGHAFWAMISLTVLIAPAMAVAPSFFADSFPTAVRQTGTGVAYNLGLVMAGTVTVICQQIMALTNDISWIVAVYLIVTMMALGANQYLRRHPVT
jgi:MHS family shikimate/dehydroshikimate transporter-like MFS transporter